MLLYMGAFVFFGFFMWDSIVDRTFRKKPSDWLGYSYWATMAMVLGYCFRYLDEIGSHPYRSLIIGLFVLAVVCWLTVVVLRKAAKWDKQFDAKKHNRSQHH